MLHGNGIFTYSFPHLHVHQTIQTPETPPETCLIKQAWTRKKHAKTDPKVHFFGHQKPSSKWSYFCSPPYKWAKINGFHWGYNHIYRVYNPTCRGYNPTCRGYFTSFIAGFWGSSCWSRTASETL